MRQLHQDHVETPESVPEGNGTVAFLLLEQQPANRSSHDMARFGGVIAPAITAWGVVALVIASFVRF